MAGSTSHSSRLRPCTFSSLSSTPSQLIALKRHPEEAHAPVANVYPPFVPFRDAGYGPNTYTTTLLDCLHGLHKAISIGLVDIKAIDPITTDFYERVENGDLNWFGRKFLALASPKDERRLGHHPSSSCRYAVILGVGGGSWN